MAAWLLFPEPSYTHPHLLLNGVFPPCPSFFQASPKFTLKNNIYIYLQFSNSKIASSLQSLVDSPTHPALRAHARAAPQAVPRAPCFCRQGLPRPAAVLCPPRLPAHLVSAVRCPQPAPPGDRSPTSTGHRQSDSQLCQQRAPECIPRGGLATGPGRKSKGGGSGCPGPGLCKSWRHSEAQVPLTHGDGARPPPQAMCRGGSTDMRVIRGWVHPAGPLPNRLPQSLFPLPQKWG